MGFFETWGYPETMRKEPKPSKSGIQTVFQSKYYQEFKALRGLPQSKFFASYRTKKEEKEYWERSNDFEEVYKILVHLRANLIRAATRKGKNVQPVEVDLDYLYEVGSSQDFFCALTGNELEFTRGGSHWLGKWCNPQSCTIDRIDSSKGYVEGNIQLITWKANCLKQHLNNEEFIEFCKDVAFEHR
jgi:hypothetical protein